MQAFGPQQGVCADGDEPGQGVLAQVVLEGNARYTLLVHVGDLPAWAEPDDLVTVRLPQHDGGSWRLGKVQWIRYLETNRSLCRVGVELLGQEGEFDLLSCTAHAAESQSQVQLVRTASLALQTVDEAHQGQWFARPDVLSPLTTHLCPQGSGQTHAVVQWQPPVPGHVSICTVCVDLCLV